MSGKMEINIRGPNGGIKEYTVKKKYLLKKLFRKYNDVVEKEMTYFFDGNKLEESVSFGDSGLPDGCTIDARRIRNIETSVNPEPSKKMRYSMTTAEDVQNFVDTKLPELMKVVNTPTPEIKPATTQIHITPYDRYMQARNSRRPQNQAFKEEEIDEAVDPQVTKESSRKVVPYFPSPQNYDTDLYFSDKVMGEIKFTVSSTYSSLAGKYSAQESFEKNISPAVNSFDIVDVPDLVEKAELLRMMQRPDIIPWKVFPENQKAGIFMTLTTRKQTLAEMKKNGHPLPEKPPPKPKKEATKKPAPKKKVNPVPQQPNDVVKLAYDPGTQCTMCASPYEDPVRTICGHQFCRECVMELINVAEEADDMAKCPFCLAPTDVDTLVEKADWNKTQAFVQDEKKPEPAPKPKPRLYFYDFTWFVYSNRVMAHRPWTLLDTNWIMLQLSKDTKVKKMNPMLDTVIEKAKEFKAFDAKESLIPQVVERAVRTTYDITKYREAKVEDAEKCSQHCQLAITLRDYQQQSVEWLVDQERHPSGTSSHWFWTTFVFPDGQKCFYSPYFKILRFSPLPPVTGGFLCSEMGLGKTCMIVALINANSRSYTQSLRFGLEHAKGEKPELKAQFTKPGVECEDIDERVLGVDGKEAGCKQWWEESKTSRDRVLRDAHDVLLENPRYSLFGRKVVKTTLIVAPVSLVGQWGIELSKCSAKPLKVFLFYGSKRTQRVDEIEKCDVVLTTYQIAQVEHGHGPRSILHQFCWHRIVLDEGHTIRQTKAGHSRAVMELEGYRRWIVTGTPINKDFTDLEGEMRFLNIPCAGETVTGVVNFQEDHNLLDHIFSKMMMRHKKKQHFRYGDLPERYPLIELPDRNEQIMKVEFTEQQRDLYDCLRKEIQDHYHSLLQVNLNYARRNVLSLMSMLRTLRQMCSGGRYSREHVLRKFTRQREKQESIDYLGDHGVADAQGNIHAKEAAFNADDECVICLDQCENPVQTPCNHQFCKECIMDIINGPANRRLCPICRKPVEEKTLLLPAMDPSEVEALGLGGKEDKEKPKDSVEFNKKVDLMMLKILSLRKAAKKEGKKAPKSLVFTQFTQTYNALMRILDKNRMKYARISGDMNAVSRKTMLESFNHDDDCAVFLMSIRTGATGLTLTAAQYVFMFEPCLNPALTLQAINRVHRIGQRKEVTVFHMVVRHSLEEIMYEYSSKALEAQAAGEDEYDGDGDSLMGMQKIYNGGQGSSTGVVAAGSLNRDTASIGFDQLERLLSR